MPLALIKYFTNKKNDMITATRWDTLRYMVSNRVFMWIVVGNISAFIVAGLEISVALSLNIILDILGFPVGEAKLPSFMQDFAPTEFMLFVIVLSLFTGRVIFSFFTNMSSSFSYVLISAKIKMAVFFGLLQRSKPMFLSAAAINFRNGEVAKNTATFISCLNALFNATIQALVLLAMMMWLTWSMTLIGLISFCFIGMVILGINREVQKVAVKIPDAQMKINKGIERTARNWLLVRILRTQDKEYSQQINHQITYGNLDIRLTALSTINNLFPNLIGSYLIILLITVNVFWLDVDAGTFISFLYIFLRFTQAVSGGSALLGKLTASRPYSSIGANLLKESSKEERQEASKPTLKINIFGRDSSYIHTNRFSDHQFSAQSKPPSIQLKNIYFGFESNKDPVLSNFSISLSGGQQIAIVGPSGSGKSTLLGIILGILEPSKGTVLIEGMPPEKFFKCQAVSLGYVGTESFLFEGTIADNLRYGATDSVDTSEEACLNAMKQASLDELIRANPKILNHEINENGEGLSAGQKQRLGLARALLGKPQLLILDEVSANLDIDTESGIATTVSKLKGSCTTVIVSHRAGMLAYTDKTIRIKDLKK